MSSILVIDQSPLFRKFAVSLLELHGFKVHVGRSAFDGLNQLRSHRPDLVIIDDGLNRQGVNNFLKKKGEDVNIKDIPIIFIAREFTQERIVELCRIKVRRFLVKPLKIDQFLNTVSSFFKFDIFVDKSECQLNLHVNENLFLIEVARGVNKTKLDLVHWKIREVMLANSITDPKIMLLVSDVHMDDEGEAVLEKLLKSLIVIPGKAEDVKVLTGDQYIKKAIGTNPSFAEVDICNNLIEAIDAFFGKKGLEKLTSNQDLVHKIYLSTNEDFDLTGQIDLNYKTESGEEVSVN